MHNNNNKSDRRKKTIMRTILTVCNIGANKGLSSLNSATSMACGIIVNGIIFSITIDIFPIIDISDHLEV